MPGRLACVAPSRNIGRNLSKELDRIRSDALAEPLRRAAAYAQPQPMAHTVAPSTVMGAAPALSSAE